MKKQRKSWRTTAVILGAVVPLIASAQSGYAGQVFTVKTANGTGVNSIYWAIQQVDANGNSAGIINIQNSLGVINASYLPDLTVGVTINGGLNNTLSGEGLSRILFVNAPGQTVVINNLTMTDGLAHGGNGGTGGGGGGAGLGGAVFVNSGTVNFDAVSFTANAVVGGTGANGATGGGGGGGGLDYAGGMGASSFNGFSQGAGGGGGAHSSAGSAASGATGGAGGGVHGGVAGTSGGATLNGASATIPDGGGGGGGLDTSAFNATAFGGMGGAGSDFGGGGGGGGSNNNNAGAGGAGGFGAGGGGGADSGSGIAGNGGVGGFGGGGGGAGTSGSATAAVAGSGGLGGGTGGAGGQGAGGGGAAFGAAVFARSGTSVSFTDSAIDAGSAMAGSGGSSGLNNNGSAGAAAGSGLFLMGGNTAFNVSNAAAVQTIAGSISQSGASSISKIGPGTLQLSGNNAGVYQYTGGTTVNAGTLIFDAPGAFPIGTALTVNNSSSAVAANLGTRFLLQVSALNISRGNSAWTGKLDLTDNDMDLQSGSLATVNSQVAQGFGSPSASWQGSGGITSSTAAADSAHLTAVGVIQNNQSGMAIYNSSNQFDGTTPGAGDLLLKYTYYGDTNLNGAVDGSDYSRIDSAYITDLATPGVATGWFNGDFNYDGVINGSDYTLIDNAFNQQQIGRFTSAVLANSTSLIGGSSPSAVPEPTASGIAMISVSLLGRRRNRR